VQIEVVTVGPLQTNCYILCDGDECVVIDPGDEPDKILAVLRNRGISAIVATHLHFDHVGAVGELVKLSGAPFYVHKDDWDIRDKLTKLAEHFGYRVDLPNPKFLGDSVEWLRVLHTPGHTPGSVSLIGDGFVFTGDTLFYQAVGRADLPGGNWRQLVNSVCRLYQLPDEYVVYAGHGPSTTIGLEKRENPLVNLEHCV